MNILIVDDEPAIREAMSLLLELNLGVTTTEAANAAKAIDILKDRADFTAIVCDYHMPGGNGDLLYSFLLEQKLTIPFIFCSSSLPEEFEIFKQKPPYAAVVKPELFPNLSEHIRHLLKKPVRPEYVRLRLTTVLRHGLQTCNLYAKLADDKYVKVVQQGDVFDANDFARFDSKKIEFLFCKSDDAKIILNQILKNMSSIAAEPTTQTPQQNLDILTANLETVSDFNQALGFTPELQKLVQESLSLSVKTIQKHPKLNELYSQMTVDPERYFASHSTLLAYLCCGIASLMHWTSDLTYYKFSLAAILHDLTLGLEELAKIDTLKDLDVNIKKFTTEEYDRYSRHPADAAALCETIPNVPADVSTILLQHHELPNGSGFPNGIGYQRIGPFSAVFIVAERMIAFHHKNGGEDHVTNFINSIGPSYSQGPFREVIDVLAHALVAQSAAK